MIRSIQLQILIVSESTLNLRFMDPLGPSVSVSVDITLIVGD